MFGLLFPLFILWNCGPVYPEDPNGNTDHPVPAFSNAQLGYHSGRGELHCGIKVLYDHPLTQVMADITLLGFEEATLTIMLSDSGLYGDALPGDNYYSRNIPLNRIDSLDGKIMVHYMVEDIETLIHSYFDTLDIVANRPPVITEIIMPDTLIRPESGTRDLFIYVHVDDPDGIHDVVSGYFQVYNITGGAWGQDYPLYDNGQNGDEKAGDGVFSTGLTISASAQPVTNYFRFRVKDSAANFSEWYPDSVVVR